MTSYVSRGICLVLACAMILTTPGFQACAEAAEIIRPASVLLAGHLAPTAISPSLSLSSLAAPMAPPTLAAFGLTPAPALSFSAATPMTTVPSVTAIPTSTQVAPVFAQRLVHPAAISTKIASQIAPLARLFDGARRFTNGLTSSQKPEYPSEPPQKPASPKLHRPVEKTQTEKTREPFVPATRRAAELELLTQKDPESASALAISYLQGDGETRREVRLAALRVLEAMPLAKILPFYQQTLVLCADPLVRKAKIWVSDPGWYIQRAILLRLMRETESVKSDEAVVNAVKTAYKDHNASVRLAAAAALRAMDIDPGPEIDPAMAKASQNRSQHIFRLGVLTFSGLLAFVAPFIVASPTHAQEITSSGANAFLQFAVQVISFLLMIIVSAVIFALIYTRLMRSQFSGSADKSDAKKTDQRFNDIEGIGDSLIEIQEVFDYLRHPEQFQRMGARAPKGILLEGPPGTGKTLMARALAGETNSKFFSVSGSDFVEVFVGVGASRVRGLFAKAAKNKPAVIFIDEIDAMGKARSGHTLGSNSENDQTLNALLSGIDGFEKSKGIVVVAATNRAGLLDPALLRPGRFDRKIYVGKPHMRGREAIATLHATDKRLAPEVDLAHLARRTIGLAGADIENILNEAALLAIRRGADAIETKDIEDAIDRGTIGAKRDLPMSDAEKKRVAYHEAGHALANLLNEKSELRKKTEKITIVPHGENALGFAQTGSEGGDKNLSTVAELEARIDHAIGGLVAERLVFGDWSTGPSSDLETATSLARTMVQNLGKGKKTGLAVTTPDSMGYPPFGEAVAEKVWREVNAILAESKKRVTSRLKSNRHVLEALVQALLEKETLIGEEIENIVHRASLAPTVQKI